MTTALVFPVRTSILPTSSVRILLHLIPHWQSHVLLSIHPEVWTRSDLTPFSVFEAWLLIYYFLMLRSQTRSLRNWHQLIRLSISHIEGLGSRVFKKLRLRAFPPILVQTLCVAHAHFLTLKIASSLLMVDKGFREIRFLCKGVLFRNWRRNVVRRLKVAHACHSHCFLTKFGILLASIRIRIVLFYLKGFLDSFQRSLEQKGMNLVHLVNWSHYVWRHKNTVLLVFVQVLILLWIKDFRVIPLPYSLLRIGAAVQPKPLNFLIKWALE